MPSSELSSYCNRLIPNLPLRRWVFTLLLTSLALFRSSQVHARYPSLTSGFYRSVRFNFNQPRAQTLKSKDKVEFLGAVLKRHIADLRQTKNKQVELVFLVDNSGSVGSHNFFNEIKFVRKLLADFTVDENTTRVAIVTFSSRPKIIKHVDFLTSPSPDNHKCSLLEEYMPKIRYTGGGTFTLGAFKMADNILRHARKDARKAVILITDGFSNAGDPRPLAARMRSNGVKIFTFGIRHGNVQELRDMASHPKNETCYILGSFEEFEALARRALHEDLQGGSYRRQISKRCDKLCRDGRDCCDEKAFCTCGTHTGNYECLCQKGYYGNGLKGGCLPCPSGTYKNSSRPGDIKSCTLCPDENHMTEEGATSVDQCQCKKGFRKFGENRCASLVCEKLSAPSSGYFVNDKCSNNFNAACGTRCQPGYDLQGASLRICQEDGKWSGNATQCVMKTCPFLPTPKNGNRICSRGDFTYSTVCRFTCDKGYKLIGSRKRTCLAIAYWSGITTRCREITCQHLRELSFGTVSPEVCTGGGEVPFGTTCKMTCNKGYTLDGPQTKQCTPDGIWSPVDTGEVSRCIDTRPPLVVCPSKIVIDAEKDTNTANVTWIPPLAIDNSGLVPTLTAIPAVEPPTRFPIGESEVTYVAEDASKNKQECKFSIVVRDTQPPRVDRCPRELTVVSEKALTNISWEEPLFSDNSNQPLRITKTHVPNSLFTQGVTHVTYTAFDQSDNDSNCTIKINVIEHLCIVPPAPANGLRDCYKGETGVHCSLSCVDGYAFAITPPNEYYCDFKNHQWTPADKMPFPDCSAQQVSNDVVQPAKLVFMGKVSCNERTTLNRIASNFQNRVSQLVNNMCGDNMNCNVDDLHTTCEEENEYNRIRVLLGRSKREATTRSVRQRRDLKAIGSSPDKDQHSIITFDFKLEGTSQSSGNLTKDTEHQEEVIDSMKNILEQLKTEAEKMEFDEDLLFTNITYEADQPKFICKSGSVLIDNKCVNCPVGTFFNVVHRRCLSCGKGTYQHQEGMVTCMVCPAHTSTLSEHSKTITECKAQCLPGSFSHDGLEFCETCAIGYYQPSYAQKECLKCPNGTSTVTRGSRLISNCEEYCKPGYVSETGMEPCIACPLGTYQSVMGKTSCFLCPNKTPTNTTGSTKLQDCKDWELQGDIIFGQQTKQTKQVSFHICLTKPCKNGGTCKHERSKFKCLCPIEFTGSRCEVKVDGCKAKPCLNGGTCSTLNGSYRCTCKEGFSGKKCEIDLDGCTPNPCQNGARCVDTADAFRCICENGFEGAACEKNIDECASKPCMNGGTCVDFIGRYSCTCKDGYEGVNCEINIDECATAPCQNNATCYDKDNGYTCSCIPGFVGKKCEEEVKECLKSPCLNAGTCENRINGYVCRCQPQYTGKECETELDSTYIIQFDASSTTNYAALTIEKPLTAFSLSFWMKSKDLYNYGTIVSYATTNNTNAIVFMDYSGFILYINGNNINTDIVANDGLWHHIVVTWTNLKGEWNVYLDGFPTANGADLFNDGVIPGGGSFVVGQEQDEVGGNFNQRESFIGQLGQLNVWDRVISLHEIEHMLTNCEKIGNIIAWPSIQGSLQGEVKKIPSVFCEDCKILSNPNYGKVHITDNSTGSNAIYSCHKGYILAGPPERMCLASGEWNHINPDCEKVNCNRPKQLKNGYVMGRIFTYDSRVRYTCNRGYKLVGSNTSYCMENGEWSNTNSICEEITCSSPLLSNHTILINKESRYLPKFIANFKCASGYKMITEHSKLVCQSDGTWDKSIPTCDGTLCGNPPDIKNGLLQEKIRERYFVGDAIKYKCNFGYTLQNGTNPDGILQCQPDGLWEKSLPICGIINCGNPPAIEHGSVTFKGTDYLKTAEYSCHPGYEISSDELLECLEESVWMPKAPSCNPVLCKQPERVENAEIIASNNTYESILTYKCKTGFQLVGDSKRECAANGNWTGKSPKCTPILCPKPDEIDNGHAIETNYTYGSIVRFKCNPGYSISNTSDILCGSNGTWQNPPPTCTPAKCPPPPTVKYGNFNASVKTFSFLNTVDYYCESGYILSGAQKLKCNETLLWSPAAPVCDPIKCPKPEHIENGIVRTDGLEYNRKAEYECLLNFKMIGKASRICVVNKTWTGKAPKCVPLTCNEPELIDNGSIMFGNLSVGAILKYKCSAGYYLLGDKDRICLSDLTWSGNTGKCLPVLCPYPAPIRNGYHHYIKRTYKSKVSYRCKPGYKLVGLTSRVCTENKTWSSSAPKCEVADKACPQLKIKYGYASPKNATWALISCNRGYSVVGPKVRECLKNGSWSGGNEVMCYEDCSSPPLIDHGKVDGLRTYNKNITYQCEDGYKLEGNANRTCLLDGKWSGITPKCMKITCPSPVDIANGTFRHLRVKPEPLLIYSCNSNFKLEGVKTLKCAKNGSWTPPTPPKCVEQLCPEIQVPPNATISTTKRLIRTTVYFICDEGFRQSWNTSLYCNPNLKWTGAKPVCRQYACVVPNDIPNGYVLLPKSVEVTPIAKKFLKKTTKHGNSRLYKLGSTLTYTCKSGYTLVGDKTRKCGFGYKWLGTEPECVPSNCPQLSIVNGVVAADHERHSGATVIFKCLRNFQPQGKPILICSSNGEWIGEPVCKANACPEIPVPPNAYLSTQVRNVQSQVRILCNPGFESTSQTSTATVFCLPNLEWTKGTISCKPVSCLKPVPIANGKNDFGTNFTFNSTVRYGCKEGYNLIGHENRTCQANRTWSGEAPTCERKTCGKPPFISYGYYKKSDTLLTYFCNEGYNITGVSVIACGLGGKWNFSELPICEPNRCEYDMFISYGNIKPIFGEVGRVSSKIKVSCDIGYQLRGEEILLCLPSGVWNGTWPKCEPISCPKPPPFENGNFKLPDALHYGQHITFSCNEDFVISGNAVPMCQANGTWSSEWPKCLLNICPVPEVPENGKISSSNRQVGSSISYYCKDGYTINGSAKRSCLVNRTWSGVDPFCEKLKCDNLTVHHGQVSIEFSQIGNDRAQYKCDPGYRIKPGLPSWLTCENGKWIGLQPSCVPKKCPQAPGLNNAAPVRGELAYGEKVIYKCLSGYEIVDVNFLVCGPAGKYVGKMPECEKSSCGPPPGIQYATMTMSTSEKKAVILCNQGYTLEGSAVLNCLPNKTWPESDAKCIPVDCGPPIKLNKASVSLPNGTTYGAFAEYTCYPGMVISGRAVSMCQMNGTWQTMDDTSCVLQNCGEPIMKENSRFIGFRFTVEALVFYACEQGYKLKGATLAFCLKNGKWSNPSPDCNPVSCGEPPEPPYEGLIISSEGHHYKNLVEYGCYGRMMPDGPTVIQCTVDGTWNGTATGCYEPPRAVCGPPLVRKPETVKLVGSSYTEGDRVFYLCRHGLSPKKRPSILVCQPDGTWDDEAECNIFCKFTCRNGGRCIGYNRCKCQPGYAGSRCEKPVCILPCLNGGYCGSPFKCTCKAGYAGTRCQDAHCRRKCENGGRCIQGDKCHCPAGFLPPYCSKRTSELASLSSQKQWTSQSQKQKMYPPIKYLLISKPEPTTTATTTTTTTTTSSFFSFDPSEEEPMIS